MPKDCYSPLKIFHHRNRLDALRAGNRPRPLHVQISPTNRCNMNCSFCAYRTEGYSSNATFNVRDELPTADVIKIFDDCERLGIKAVEITGGGEPTIHPGFAMMAQHLRSLGIDYGVVTNGSRGTDSEILDALSKASWVRFSIDAGLAQTYAETRRTSLAAFDRVRTTIQRLRGLGRPVIVGVGFVVTKDNWSEILQAAKNAKEDGSNNFRISAVFQNDGVDYFNTFYKEAGGLCRQAKQLEDNQFTVFNLFGERLDDLAQQSPDYKRCMIQELVTYIGADGNVYRCCMLAYNERGLLGSIKDRGFYALWQSGDVARKFTDFDARACPRCMFNNKNRTIAYACNPAPDHVNFL